MKKNKINWFEIVFWIVIIILFIMILTRIFGKSATDIQIYLAIVMVMITIMGHIVKMNREIGEMRVHMIESFKRVREDINKLQKKK